MRLSLAGFPRTPRDMTGFLYVALGGAIGASARHWLSRSMLTKYGEAMPFGFPTSTLCANVIGSFLMGILAAYIASRVNGFEEARLFLGVGILGGFTTFSAFSLEAIMMLERKAYGVMASYITASVIGSLLALFLGLILARKVFSL